MTEHQEDCDFLEENNNIKSDFTYECKYSFDDVIQVSKIYEALISIGEPLIKVRSTVNLSLAEKKELDKFVKKVKNCDTTFKKTTNLSEKDIEDLRIALPHQNS